MTGPFGNSNGPFVDEYTSGKNHGPIEAIFIRYGNKVNGLNIRYGSQESGWYGGSGTKEKHLDLYNEEKIIEVAGWYSDTLNEIRVKTNQNRILGPVGTATGTDFVSDCHEAGCYLDYNTIFYGENAI